MKKFRNASGFQFNQNDDFLFKSLLCLVAIIIFNGIVAVYFGYGKIPIAQHYVPFHWILSRDIFLLTSFCSVYSIAKKTLPPKELILIICAMVVYVLTVRPLDSLEIYQHFFRNLLFYDVAFLLLIFSASLTLKQISRIIYWVQNFVLISATLGLLLLILKLDHSFGGRSTATLYTPHAAAGVFLLVSIISTEEYLTESKICLTDFKVNVLIVALICTGSFSFLLGFLVYGVTLLFRVPLKAICKRIVFHVLFFLGYFLIGLFDQFLIRLAFIFSPVSKTISGRVEQSTSFFEDYRFAQIPRDFHSYDSLYLLLLANLGVLGLLIFLLLVVIKTKYLYHTFTLAIPKNDLLKHQISLKHACRSVFIFTVIYFGVVSHLTNTLLNFPFNALYALIFACCIRYAYEVQIKKGQFHT